MGRLGHIHGNQGGLGFFISGDGIRDASVGSVEPAIGKKGRGPVVVISQGDPVCLGDKPAGLIQWDLGSGGFPLRGVSGSGTFGGRFRCLDNGARSRRQAGGRGLWVQNEAVYRKNQPSGYEDDAYQCDECGKVPGQGALETAQPAASIVTFAHIYQFSWNYRCTGLVENLAKCSDYIISPIGSMGHSPYRAPGASTELCNAHYTIK